MENIKQSIQKLDLALKQGKTVVCNQHGEWHVEGVFMGWIRRLFGLEEARFMTITSALIKLLNELESVPISFHSRQSFEYMTLVNVIEEVLKKVENFTSIESYRQAEHLKCSLIALQYRLESANGGLDIGEIQKEVYIKLIAEAKKWKKEQVILSERELSGEDLTRLQETARFSEFAKLIIEDEEIRHSFFEWILRDKISPAPFIEFPAVSQKIVDCALNGRIGRHGGNSLKITKTNNEKIITLPVEGKPVNLLNEKQEVVFRGNYRMTIDEIFKVFKNKKFHVGNLEFMADGIINWNVHQLGWWNAKTKQFQRVDISQARWWKQLPIFEIISLDQAKMKYQMPLDGRVWNVAATATRGTPTLDFDQTHAFIEVAIPTGNGSYAIYDFGKFAFVFPSSFFENFTTFCHTVHATVAFPDENVFYTHRQHGRHSFIMNENQGCAFMDLIREDIEKSRNRNFVFQIESENCAKWTYEKLVHVLGQENVPNLFKMPLLKTEPVGFCKGLFGWVKMLPTALQIPVLTRLHLLIGAAKSTWVVENGEWVMRSLTTHEFWNTGEVYLPAFLIHQKNNGLLVADRGLELVSASKFEHARTDNMAYILHK